MRGIEDLVKGFQESMKKLVRWRMLLASAAFLAIAGCLCAHVMMGNNGWLTYRQKKAEYQKLQQEIKRMDEEKQRLDSDIRALKSDPKAIEKEAREQLRYAKPGEVIYLLPQQPGQRSAQNAQQTESARR